MKTIWKDINDWEGYYIISNKGKIISLERESNHSRGNGEKCIRKQRIVIGSQSKTYYFIALTKGGITKRKTLHRLLAIHFIPNPHNKPCVNHKNGKKWDNRLSNLEWATHKENTAHAIKFGLMKASYGMKGKIGRKNKKSKRVQQIDIKTGKVLKTWDSAHCVTRKSGWSYANICACALNTRPTANGFKWKYE